MELYHGSPYLFDHFDLSKINTGAEKQHHGYGFYFSDNAEEAVNHVHKNTLIRDKKIYLYKVKVSNSDNIVNIDDEINRIYTNRILRKLIGKGHEDDADKLSEEIDDYDWTYKQVYDHISAILGNDKVASEVFDECGITGFKIENTGWYDGDIYLIFSPSNLKIRNTETIEL